MVCKNIAQAKKRAEGYFREYEAKRRETDPNWKAKSRVVASHIRHKDDEGAKDKRRPYEKPKNDWSRKPQREQRKGTLPAEQKLRQISVTAKAMQVGRHVSKLVSNGGRNLKLKRGCL